VCSSDLFPSHDQTKVYDVGTSESGGHYAYMTFMYLSVLTGPIIFLLYFIFRMSRPRRLENMIHLRTKHLLVITMGWWVWLFILFLWLLFPSDKGVYVIAFVLTGLAWIISTLAALMLFRPMDNELARIALEMDEGDIKCKSVVEFFNRFDQKPEISHSKMGTGFSGVMRIPYFKQGDVILQAMDFSAVGKTVKDVDCQLNTQAANYLSSVPAYKDILAETARAAGSTELVVMGGVSELMPTMVRPKGDSRTEASHEVCLLREQNLISVSENFDKMYFCGVHKRLTCSFTLEPGVSDVSRLVALHHVTATIKIPKGGLTPPYEGRVFSCARMEEAFPYLLSGFRMTNHK